VRIQEVDRSLARNSTWENKAADRSAYVYEYKDFDFSYWKRCTITAGISGPDLKSSKFGASGHFQQQVRRSVTLSFTLDELNPAGSLWPAVRCSC